MKEEFKTFDHFPTTQEMIAAYEAQWAKDPTTIYYKRKNDKPKLNLVRVVILLVLVLASSVGVAFLTKWLSGSTALSIILAVTFVVIVAFIRIKHIAIWLVMLYQNIAPLKLRNRCRFEPSCSQYMILSLQKYAFFKGVK